MLRALLLLGLLLSPATVLAAGRGEISVTAGPGVAVVKQAETHVGGAADVRFLYGINDAWSARLGLQGVWLASHDGAGATQLLAPSLGLTLAADALNVVPFVEVGVALTDVRGGGLAARQYLGAQAGAGFDYLLSRHFTLSLLGRVDCLALRLAGPSMSSPSPLTGVLALHVGRVF
jgi:hypothetical protein